MKYNTEKIEKFMKENKLSKKQFCHMCGISTKTLKSIYECRNVACQKGIKIVKVLHCTLDEFLCLK